MPYPQRPYPGLIILILLCFALLPLLASRSAVAQTANGCFAVERQTSVNGVSFLCTQVYQLTGPCDGKDSVRNVEIVGTPAQTDWRITPWEPEPILIRGVELAQSAGGPIDWAMAGNDTWPDIMLMLAKGMVYGHAVFPRGSAMPFPAKATATDRDYLDFHIVCRGDPFVFWYKIEYTHQ